MLSRKNAFEYFAISVFVISLIYALAAGVIALGDGQEYPYLQGGIFLMLLLGAWLALNTGVALVARLDPQRHLRGAAKTRVGEKALVAFVLAVGTALRLLVVWNLPMQVASDYKTYYDIADLIAKGTLRTDGPGYCDYIAMFPHVYGYPCVLSLLFRIFGTSVCTAQIFNVVLSMLTVFLVYLTAKLAGGRLCGLVALVLSAFWPSQILYVNMVAGEYLFSFMLMVGLYVFVDTVKDLSRDARHPVTGVLLHVFLGIWLAMTAAIRPMALLLLVTVAICTLFERVRIPVRLTKDQPVSLVFLSKGWMRCITVIAVYLLTSALITVGITNAVDKDLASGTTSFGYNLLVGLNTESEGGWNQEDADYLYATLEETGDATQAHMACRDLAIKRLGDVKGILNLFLYKFQVLWMNDDYGTTWNLLFMDQQGTLTPELESFLYWIRGWGNIFYLLVLALSLVAGVTFWQKGASLAYPFMLMYLGTVAMHLLLENQNRYHFHTLYMLAILAAFGVRGVCEAGRVRVQQRQEERRLIAKQKREDAQKREALLLEEENLIRLRREAMNSRFDMESALKKGYITVRVSKACEDGCAAVHGLSQADRLAVKDAEPHMSAEGPLREAAGE